METIQITTSSQLAENKSPPGAQPHLIDLSTNCIQGSQWKTGWKDCQGPEELDIGYENIFPTNVIEAVPKKFLWCGFLNRIQTWIIQIYMVTWNGWISCSSHRQKTTDNEEMLRERIPIVYQVPNHQHWILLDASNTVWTKELICVWEGSDYK